jgi:hypothetical protein
LEAGQKDVSLKNAYLLNFFLINGVWYPNKSYYTALIFSFNLCLTKIIWQQNTTRFTESFGSHVLYCVFSWHYEFYDRATSCFDCKNDLLSGKSSRNVFCITLCIWSGIKRKEIPSTFFYVLSKKKSIWFEKVFSYCFFFLLLIKNGTRFSLHFMF